MLAHRHALLAVALLAAAAAPGRAQDLGDVEPSSAVRTAAGRIEHLPYWGRSAEALAAPLGAAAARPAATGPNDAGAATRVAGGASGSAARKAIAGAVLAVSAVPGADVGFGLAGMAWNPGQRVEAAEQTLAGWGLPARDLASAAAFAFVTEWQLAAGRPLDGDAAAAAARAMARRFAQAAPEAVGGLDEGKRADAYAAMLGHAEALVEAARGAKPGLAAGVRQAAAACFQRQFGLTASTVRLDVAGGTPAVAVAAGDGAAAGSRLSGGAPPRRTPSRGSESAPPPRAAHGARPGAGGVAGRAPVGATLRFRLTPTIGSSTGSRLDIWFLYAGGIAANCAAVDPAALDLSPGAAEPAPDCSAARWSQRGDVVWIQENGKEPEEYGELSRPAPSRLAFAGVSESARYYGIYGDAATLGRPAPGLLLANRNALQLLPDGRFTGFESRTAGYNDKTTTHAATAGRYVIDDGYVITMTFDDGTVVRRPFLYIPPDPRSPKSFVFLKGRQYADEGEPAR